MLRGGEQMEDEGGCPSTARGACGRRDGNGDMINTISYYNADEKYMNRYGL